MSINIKVIDYSCNFENNRIIEDLAGVLCFEEPEMIETSKEHWRDWLSNKIEGDKITIAAEETDNNNHRLVGVVRFWKTPYCNYKWLIEGLEVISTKRRKGIGRAMVECGLDKLRKYGIEKVSANIANNNISPIKLHESLGFVKTSSGSVNSFGDFRERVDEYTLILKRD